MLLGMVNRIMTKLFGNKVQEEPNIEAITTLYPDLTLEEFIDCVKIDLIDPPVILNPEGSKTLLILNDVPEATLLFNMDIDQIYKETGIDINKEFKIVLCNGRYSNIAAYKYAKEHKIDKALLDIVVVDSIISHKFGYMELDGFDVAAEIEKYNPQCHLAIWSNIVLSINSNQIKRYLKKVQSLDIKNILNYYINRNSLDRPNRLKEFLFTDHYRLNTKCSIPA